MQAPYLEHPAVRAQPVLGAPEQVEQVRVVRCFAAASTVTNWVPRVEDILDVQGGVTDDGGGVDVAAQHDHRLIGPVEKRPDETRPVWSPVRA